MQNRLAKAGVTLVGESSLKDLRYVSWIWCNVAKGTSVGYETQWCDVAMWPNVYRGGKTWKRSPKSITFQN